MIEIRIPRMPPKSISPNKKRSTHWTAYRDDEQSFKKECYWEAREQAPYLSGKLTGPVHYTAVIALTKGSKRLDDDNARGWLKQGQDGLAIHFSNNNDKLWVCDGVTFTRDPTGPGWVLFRIDGEMA